ncbi:PREDICTED: major facilitator superfamily domain-containing protein 8 [Papilio polytes]|uniref:major facilitator superfamily domain-containing protein 8 n=1 Tax=Papilio polytes TaxID=76194 RepID=UPI0006762C3B|nr:PREDICTED: major facilitator superfamily domain-containing protein 8 [Papilio polytes]
MEWLKRLFGRDVREGNNRDLPEDGLETAQERRRRWRSVYVIYFTMFQMSLGFSIVLTGVWPYLDMLQPGTKKDMLGVAVGASPLGQLMLSPLLGLWANRAGVRAPLSATLGLFALASALYSQLHLTRPYAVSCMIAARFLIGVSSSNVAVARAYLSAATREEERTRAVSAVSLAQVLGFVAGPALQAAAAPLGTSDSSGLRFDMYSAPGLLNAALGLINLLLLMPGCFHVSDIALREAVQARGERSEKEVLKSLKPDYVSSWMLVGAFFVLVFNFVLLETLASTLTMEQFGWGKAQALQYLGALMSAGALVACLVFAAIPPLTKLLEERALMLWGGFLPVVVASLLCIPWGPGAPPLADPGNAEAHGGCPQESQPWCAESRALSLAQFLLAYGCMSVGYPLGVTLIQTIFSKVLGPRPQGVWMGVLTGAGCLSRALGPVFVAGVYARRGPAAAFSATAALTLLALLALRAVYPRLRAAPPTHPTHPPPPAELQPLASKHHAEP